MRKLTPRAKFIATVSQEKLAAYAWEAMRLASTHDPDHDKLIRHSLKEIRILGCDFQKLESRIQILERQIERIGAPQYRRIK
jgi:hypothetical protein